MPASFHLQPLLDLASTRTDEAARRLGELVAAERDVEQKLKMLEDYRTEYHERFVQAARTVEGQQAWLAQRTKLKAFDTLAQRHQHAVARSEARQEQKQSDEHAARRGGEDA